jgi:hypothetical protein
MRALRRLVLVTVALLPAVASLDGGDAGDGAAARVILATLDAERRVVVVGEALPAALEWLVELLRR